MITFHLRDGDIYAALKDCVSSLKLDPNQIKPFHRLARCVLDLGHPHLADKALALLKERFPQQSNGSAFSSLYIEIQKKLTHQRLEKESAQRELDEQPELEDSDNFPTITVNEKLWRAQYWDYTNRFCGHCNTTTDIKEANFFGRYIFVEDLPFNMTQFIYSFIYIKQ